MLFVIFVFYYFIRFHLKAWCSCTVPARAPANDLHFIKYLKLYENEHSKIVAITKISNRLWYITEETTALVFFDNTISNEIRKLTVQSIMKLSNQLLLTITFQNLGEKCPGTLL